MFVSLKYLFLKIIYMYFFFFQEKNTGLGIMIVEGSHSEIGRGVFIGDMTKDGPADKVYLHFTNLSRLYSLLYL